ncbi:TonB-dependent receptor [Porphyromonas catoniae]|uniref:TonB-dependent receptor n=1 Tax=Porphyromonas catoniae TaxID=41976 RepID=UPI0023F2A3DA|nr:TonB-dependent receptor [Porphyromonas catoniae]
MNSPFGRYLLRLLLLPLFLASALPVWAQQTTHSISGRVYDEAGEALPSANVSLLLPDGKLRTGATTAKDGSFVLRGITSGSYTLRISFVGYKTLTRAVQVSSKDLPLGTLTLEEDGAVLSDVNVVAKANEVVVKGDTLEYNATSYTTQQGAAIIELLKQLPGASVDEKGQVTVNGKTVSQIMVDGKRFFEGDPKVALNNLPAELVDKVQVMDRESESSRMSGFSDGNEETIINLTIKAGKKRGLFGTAFVGGGTDKRYEASAMFNRFTGDNQLTVLGSINNTNNAGFSDIAQDLSQASFMYSLSGGRRGPGGGGGRIPGQIDGIQTSKVLGGNLSHTFNPSLILGGNLLAGNTTKDKTTASTIQNILSSSSTTQTGKTSEHNDKDTYAGNFRFQWKIDSLTELIISPQLRYGKGIGTYTSDEQTLNDATNALISSSSLRQRTSQSQTDGDLRIDASRRLSDRGRTLTLSASGTLSNELGSGTYLSDIVSVATGTEHVDRTKRSGEYRVRLGWVEPLGKGFFGQATYQIKGTNSFSERKAFDADLTGQYTVENARYSNEFHSDFLTHQVGLALKKKGSTYDLTAGVNLERSNLSSYTVVAGVNARSINRSTTNYSPTLRFSYKPKRTTELRIDYFGRSFQPTTDQLAPVQDVTNPLVVYEGNQNLLPGFQHNVFGRYNNFWTSTQTSLALFGHARYVQNDIVSRTTYDLTTGVRKIGYTNVSGNAMAGLGGFFTQVLPGKKFSIRLGSRNQLVRQIAFINDEENRSLSLRLNEDLTLNYRNSFLDINLRGALGYYNATNSLTSVSSTATKDYSVGSNMNLTLPLGFAIEADGTYTTTQGYAVGFENDQWLLNAGISFSFLKGKRATLRLKGYDLLDSRRSIYRNITATSITTEESNTLGRYAMLHFIYRFDSFAGGGSRSDMKQQGHPGPPPPM